jgi:SAM-dependent methyltransferase
MMNQNRTLRWLRIVTRPLGNVGRPVRRVRNSIRRRSRQANFEGGFLEFKRLAEQAGGRLPVCSEDRHPVLNDATPTTGFDRHYVYHIAWAARVLAETRPAEHVDIGSSLYFAATASAFVPLRFYDYRPAALRLSNFSSDHADLTKLSWPDQSIASLSCMHVAEHVGLGRYGDPLDVDGDLKAMRDLQRVLAPGGSLLFVVPVGRPRVCFNAHRIYAYAHVIAAFAELELKQFALIPDDPRDGDLIVGAAPSLVAKQNYACGCFWFRRPNSSKAA